MGRELGLLDGMQPHLMTHVGKVCSLGCYTGYKGQGTFEILV